MPLDLLTQLGTPVGLALVFGWVVVSINNKNLDSHEKKTIAFFAQLKEKDDRVQEMMEKKDLIVHEIVTKMEGITRVLERIERVLDTRT